MDRRTALKLLSFGIGSSLINHDLKALVRHGEEPFTCRDFGTDFVWGAATAAYQIEGAWNADGKGPGIWDRYSHEDGRIKGSQTGDVACDFYHRYRDDLKLAKSLNLDAFRFSISWPRILPTGRTPVNQKGIDYYHRVIDAGLENGLDPWVTLYHWDLPQELENRGGWTNREIVDWFSEYVMLCVQTYGDKVKNWMVLNEPFAFTGLGYLLRTHAPGRWGPKNFIPAVHNVALCQGIGGRILKENVPGARVGTTFSISVVDPHTSSEEDIKTAATFDALLNRLFIEPSLGMGYPLAELPFMQEIGKLILTNDDRLMKFDFDFIGVQNYTRAVVRHSGLMPWLHGLPVSPRRRKCPQITEMGWEVYPEGIYRALKYYARYPIKDIYVTENGAAFKDTLSGGRVHDMRRIQFYRDYLAEVLRAKNKGVNVKGYFAWSLLDNFEWAEGYSRRFGLVYVDYPTQQRIVKDSGLWFREFLGQGAKVKTK